MALDSSNAKELVHLIRDSFRVRANHDPLYVDIGDSLKRLSSNQHQVVFGRRGSGKSCLFVHVLRQSGNGGSHGALYVGIDALKRLPFPDRLKEFGNLLTVRLGASQIITNIITSKFDLSSINRMFQICHLFMFE